jgi:hypothetical protein
MHSFLIAQGYDMLPPIDIKEDNMSTIALAEKGRSTSDRTRHINIRYFWIKEVLDQGIAKISHLETVNMVADILTKPLQGAQFEHLRDLLLGEILAV